MKKWSLLFISLMMPLILVACGGNAVDEETADKYTEKAEEVITLINEREYEAITEMFDKQMEEALPVSELKELEPIIDDAGSFEFITKSTVEENDGMYTTVLSADYSEEELIYTITFTNKDEVSGLFIK